MTLTFDAKMTGKRIPDALKQLVKEAIAFRETLSPESDRGCALMGGSFLDSRLKKLIEKKVIDDSKIVGQFLEFNGAAGTFSSRIDFCYLIGLLPKSVHSDLHLIRKIRNEFGHRVDVISFDSQEIKSRCERMQTRNVGKEARPRLIFTNTCFGVLSAIDVAIATAAPFDKSPEAGLTEEQKRQSRDGFLEKFSAAIDALGPSELGTSEGKAKLKKLILGTILDSTEEDPEIEQGVAPQSATRAESNPEGGDKPQPESEERSQ